MIQLHNYTIDREEIGQGGMAVVHLAKHNLLQEQVAIKVLKRDYAHHENIRSRFLSEARILFRMSHQHIIKVTDMIEYGDLPGFVMEYVDGPSLKEYIERKGPLSNEEIQQLFSQVLLAVNYIHNKGFVHRDLKPSNFMIDKNFQLKLLDFGIVKFMDSQSADLTQTHTHQQMGTPMYMSPEQILETRNVNAASDIYSLGVVLWQMVTGRKPYDAENLPQYELQSKILNQALPLTNSPWDFFIQKATAKKAEDRFSNCKVWLNQLTYPVQQHISDPDATVFSDDTEPKTIIASVPIQDFPNVQIGSQVWMQQNLNVECFRNGDPIPLVQSNEEWESCGKQGKPAFCYYENNPEYGKTYGLLYNWYAVNDERGLAPVGWHVPSEYEWKILIDISGGMSKAGRNLKFEHGWSSFHWGSGNGKNSNGFSALPGGRRLYNGIFWALENEGHWWGATKSNEKNSVRLSLLSGNSSSTLSYIYNAWGFSVRCLKN
jgi:uncharacterized protein (TIGR02145 family)